MNEVSKTPNLIQFYGSLDGVKAEEPLAFFSLFQELVATHSDYAPALTEWTIRRVKDAKIKNIFLLEWAINQSCPKLIRRLIKNGALEHVNSEIDTAALCFSAALLGQTSTLDLLEKNGVDFRSLQDSKETIVHMLVFSEAFTGSVAEIIWLRNLIEQNPNLLTQLDSCNRTPLDCAILTKKSSLVNLFIKLRSDEDPFPLDGLDSLFLAIFTFQWLIADLLIEHGANPCAHNIQGSNLLHLLVSNDFQGNEQQTKWLRELIRKYPHLLNQQDTGGWTPLHGAALKGNDFLVSLFLELGAGKESLTGDGNTPLMIAASKNKLSAIELLIAQGATPNVQNAAGWTPLHYAAANGNDFLVSLFLELGANKEALTSKACTPLMIAASKRKLSTIELLIELGANPNSQNKDGRGWMHYLTDTSPGDTQQVEWLKKLVERHLQLLKQQNADGWTPLHCAALKGNDLLVSLFLELGADKEALTDDGDTPLLMAAMRNKLSTLDLLIKLGANPNSQDKDGRGWMHCLNEIPSADKQQMGLLKKLVKSNLHLLKQPAAGGYTPLHYAVAKGNDFLASFFLAHGADKEALTDKGNTPLMIAASYNNLSTIELLIKQGANLDFRNENGIGWMHYLTSKHFFANESEAGWLKKMITDIPSILNLGKKDQFTLMQYAAKQENTQFVDHLKSFGIPLDKLSALYINKLEGQVVSQEDNEQKIDIAQNRLNQKIKKYLLYQMNEGELKEHSAYDTDGLCEGYALLFGYYASRGKMDEFFHSLEQISLWDGTKASLNTPPIYPGVALLYPTLRDFFRQWTNDILLFQTTEKYFEAENLGQANFIEKYQIVKKDNDLAPIASGTYRLHSEESFKKLLVKSKDKSTFFSLGNETKDGSHGTGLFVSQEGLITFYDPNRSQRMKPCRVVDPVAEALTDYFLKEYQTDRVSKILYARGYEFKQPSNNDAACAIS